MSRIFSARYPGRCPECGEDIETGELLRWSDDGDAIHATHDPATAPAADRAPCPSCWQTPSVSGVCGCDV